MRDQPLVTVMIPTRKRVLKLMLVVNQLLQTKQNFEIIVLIDHDDLVSQMIAGTLAKCGVRVLMVPPLGYEEGVTACKYYVQMEEAAKGEFVWFASDDMEIEGDWFTELMKVPRTGYIVQPEISKLHASVYPRYETGFFPIVPRFAWKPFSVEMPRPFDAGASALLKSNGWQTWFLEGVTMTHDRPDELDIIMADPSRGTPERLMRLLQEREHERVRQEQEKEGERVRLELEAEVKVMQDTTAARAYAQAALDHEKEHKLLREAKQRRRFR